jgi:hypothetical protein
MQVCAGTTGSQRSDPRSIRGWRRTLCPIRTGLGRVVRWPGNLAFPTPGWTRPSRWRYLPATCPCRAARHWPASTAAISSGSGQGNWATAGPSCLAKLPPGDAEGLEVQLKGSGLDALLPHGRRARRAAVQSIREFLCSEAMHGLRIATTQRAVHRPALTQPVRRETTETAAVVTRVAPSFIRFGHFEHFSAHGQPARPAASTLADYVIDRDLPRLPRRPPSTATPMPHCWPSGQRAHRGHGGAVAGGGLHATA